MLKSTASAGAPAIRLIPSSIDSKIEIHHFSAVARPRTRRSDRNPLIYNAANDFSQKQRNKKARIRMELVHGCKSMSYRTGEERQIEIKAKLYWT